MSIYAYAQCVLMMIYIYIYIYMLQHILVYFLVITLVITLYFHYESIFSIIPYEQTYIDHAYNIRRIYVKHIHLS